MQHRLEPRRVEVELVDQQAAQLRVAVLFDDEDAVVGEDELADGPGERERPHARYSERGPDYVYNMQRLLRKFDSAKALVPQPIEHRAPAGAASAATPMQARPAPTPSGAIYYGSTSPAMDEAVALLEASGTPLDTLRVRAFPFPDAVRDFILAHERVFVVEQNRDAQLRSLLVNEFDLDPARLEPVLHYDGTPITARFIVEQIRRRRP